MRGEPSWGSLDRNTVLVPTLWHLRYWLKCFLLLWDILWPISRYFSIGNTIHSMAWPSGWEQHLLVPQQCWRNAKGDKSGHHFITWCAAPPCHKSPWLVVCCEPADKECILSEQELQNFLVQCDEDINRSSKNHANYHLKISLLWGWTFTVSQIRSKSSKGWVIS